MNLKDYKQKILKSRAEHLAAKVETETSARNQIHLVEFKLAGERYALESMHIKEVYPLKDVSFIPGVPAFVYGLINIRRRILSVIDLRPLLGLPVAPLTPLSKAIILQKNEMEFGLVAEEIIGLNKVYTDELQDSLPTLVGIRQEFLRGITSDRLLILDAEKLLNSPSIRVDQAADV